MLSMKEKYGIVCVTMVHVNGIFKRDMQNMENAISFEKYIPVD